MESESPENASPNVGEEEFLESYKKDETGRQKRIEQRRERANRQIEERKANNSSKFENVDIHDDSERDIFKALSSRKGEISTLIDETKVILVAHREWLERSERAAEEEMKLLDNQLSEEATTFNEEQLKTKSRIKELASEAKQLTDILALQAALDEIRRIKDERRAAYENLNSKGIAVIFKKKEIKEALLEGRDVEFSRLRRFYYEYIAKIQKKCHEMHQEIERLFLEYIIEYQGENQKKLNSTVNQNKKTLDILSKTLRSLLESNPEVIIGKWLDQNKELLDATKSEEKKTQDLELSILDEMLQMLEYRAKVLSEFKKYKDRSEELGDRTKRLALKLEKLEASLAKLTEEEKSVEEACQNENELLSAEYGKVSKKFLDLRKSFQQRKSESFVNFIELWKVRRGKCESAFLNILDMNVLIFKKVLGHTCPSDRTDILDPRLDPLLSTLPNQHFDSDQSVFALTESKDGTEDDIAFWLPNLVNGGADGLGQGEYHYTQEMESDTREFIMETVAKVVSGILFDEEVPAKQIFEYLGIAIDDKNLSYFLNDNGVPIEASSEIFNVVERLREGGSESQRKEEIDIFEDEWREFWRSVRNPITREENLAWDTLERYLSHYYEELSRRRKLRVSYNEAIKEVRTLESTWDRMKSNNHSLRTSGRNTER